MCQTIPVPTDLAFSLLDETSRRRALTEPESILLEAILTQGHRSQGVRFAWTPALERSLMRAAHRNSTVRKWAADHGVSEMAAYKRVEKIKAKREGKLPRGKAKG